MAPSFEAIIPRDLVALSPSCGSITVLEDDRLMWVWAHGTADPQPVMANYSSDGGRTWTPPVPLQRDDGEILQGVIAPSLIRLPSGALGMALKSEVNQTPPWDHRLTVETFHVSRDEGETWSQQSLIHPPGVHASREGPMVDSLVRLRDGRIVISYHKVLGPTPKAAKPDLITPFGEALGAGFVYDMYFSFVYYSDDEGHTWNRSRNEVHATVDGGYGGIFPLGEPQVAELPDGRLILMGWSTVGRMFRAYSEDRGESWQEAEPTELAVRRGPFALKRLPHTDDLLLIWPQLSRFEAMLGLYRHRLTCAISRDGGVTWQNHKNLISLDDVANIEPGPYEHWVSGPARQPLDRVRYHRAPGPLRNDHPYCCFYQDQALIVYGHGVLGERAIIEQTYGLHFAEVAQQYGFAPRSPSGEGSKVLGNNKIHGIPLEWFYT